MSSNRLLNRVLFNILILIIITLPLFAVPAQETVEITGKLTLEDNLLTVTTGEESFNLYLVAPELQDNETFPFDNESDYILKGYQSDKGYIFYELQTADGQNTYLREDNKPLIVSISEGTTYSVDPRRCISCRMCIDSCPVGAIRMVRGAAVIDQEKCISCGICKDGNFTNYEGCPVSAIREEQAE